MRRSGRSAVLCVALFVLAGCGGSGADPQYSPVAFEGDVPLFVGPWAAEMSELYAASKSDLEREVLADEVITQEELLALEDWYVGCMAGQGLTVTVEEFGYDLGTDDRERILAAEGVCKTDSISVSLEMQGNPDNVPPDVATHECLVRHGDLDPAFTFEEFDRMMGDTPWSPEWEAVVSSDAYHACNWDPYDLLGLYAQYTGS